MKITYPVSPDGFKIPLPQDDLIKLYAFQDCVENFGGHILLGMDEYCLVVSACLSEEQRRKFEGAFDEVYKAALVVRTPKATAG